MVVVGGALQAAAATKEGGRTGGRCTHRRQRNGPSRTRLGAIERGQARLAILGDPPGGVVHPQRPEQALLHQDVERLAGHNLQHSPEHVEPEGVVPLGARLEEEWQGGEAVAHAFKIEAWGRAPLETRPAVELVDRMRIHEAVGETTGVGEELPQTHRLGDRLGDRSSNTARPPHAGVPERGDEAMNRVVELEGAFLPQLQGEHSGDRLGHREDPPDRVGLYRQLGSDVA